MRVKKCQHVQLPRLLLLSHSFCAVPLSPSLHFQMLAFARNFKLRTLWDNKFDGAVVVDTLDEVRGSLNSLSLCL